MIIIISKFIICLINFSHLINLLDLIHNKYIYKVFLAVDLHLAIEIIIIFGIVHYIQIKTGISVFTGEALIKVIHTFICQVISLSLSKLYVIQDHSSSVGLIELIIQEGII